MKEIYGGISHVDLELARNSLLFKQIVKAMELRNPTSNLCLGIGRRGSTLKEEGVGRLVRSGSVVSKIKGSRGLECGTY